MTPPLDAIVSILRRGERVVTALGAPGAGRTALARLVAARWAAAVGTVVVADLSRARDASQIGDAVARALDVWPCDGDGPADPLFAVAQALASRGPLLLVLDGFDTLPEFALVTVVQWRQLAPSAQQLVFCREPLRLSDEVVIELGPTSDQDGNAPPGPADEAVEATRVRPRVDPRLVRFAPGAADAAAVERAVQALSAARISGEPRAIGECAWFAALVEHRAGALDRAATAYAEAERAADAAGQTWIAACARVGAGLVELERGRLAEARSILGQAEATVAGFEPRTEGILLAVLGATKARLGESVDAGWLLDRAERLMQSVDVALLPTVAGPLRGVFDLERAARARASGDARTADDCERRARDRLQSALAASDPDADVTRGESLATTVWTAATRILQASLAPAAPNGATEG